MGGCGVDAVRALDASKASVSDYYIHTYEPDPSNGSKTVQAGK
jgi:hypothetical protein